MRPTIALSNCLSDASSSLHRKRLTINILYRFTQRRRNAGEGAAGLSKPRRQRQSPWIRNPGCPVSLDTLKVSVPPTVKLAAVSTRDQRPIPASSPLRSSKRPSPNSPKSQRTAFSSSSFARPSDLSRVTRFASELKLMMTLAQSALHGPGLLSRPEEDCCSEHNEVRPR